MEDKTIKNITGWEELGQIIEWFDNEWLLFNPSDRGLGTIILFNPLTGETKQIEPSFPDIYYLYPFPTWYGNDNPLPLYDYSITQVFYLRDSNGISYALWDIKQQQIIWERKVSMYNNKPQWSPNGEKIAIAVPQMNNKFDIISIDRQGKETQLTNMGSKYENVYIGPFSWSPDGSQIAFWVDYQHESDYELNLAVLDLQKGEIINYCIGAGGTIPIWSPDNQQLAVVTSNKDTSDVKVVIIDIIHEYAFSIDQRSYPVGWMQ